MTREERKERKEDIALAKALKRLQRHGRELRLLHTQDKMRIAVEVEGVHYGVWDVKERRWVTKGEQRKVFNLLLSRLSRHGDVNVRYSDREGALAQIGTNGRYTRTWDINTASWVM